MDSRRLCEIFLLPGPVVHQMAYSPFGMKGMANAVDQIVLAVIAKKN